MLAIAGCAVLIACSKAEPPTATPRPALVEAPQALAEDAGEAFPGSVRAQVENELSFRIPGKIAERKVEAGAAVKAGQVLAILDKEDARLNLDAARADFALAESEATRSREMLQKGFISQSLLDTRENQLKLARARLALAENQSDYTVLKADEDGVITQVLAEAGETVAAGRPVMRFAGNTSREVRISVAEGRTQAFNQTARIAIQLWAVPGKIYRGRVRLLNPQADPQTRTHEVRVTIEDADDSVQLGMTANVLLGATSAEPLFRVSASAVTQVDGKPVVWRVVPGSPATAQPVSVKVMHFLNDAVVVAGALNKQDQLISAGVHRLTPGMAVTPIERQAKAAL
jgi:multidrug efflux system membrane fusion protein